jgi:hypothetical protein
MASNGSRGQRSVISDQCHERDVKNRLLDLNRISYQAGARDYFRFGK